MEAIVLYCCIHFSNVCVLSFHVQMFAKQSFHRDIHSRFIYKFDAV